MDGLVCSQSRFTLKHYSRRKFVSSAKQFLPPRNQSWETGAGSLQIF
jgi:hypothetical protein